MTQVEFSAYLGAFEQKVVIAGLKEQVFGKLEMVPTRNGKLTKTPFGKLIGLTIDEEEPVAIDYYGHLKKSTGFRKMVEEMALQTQKQVRLADCMVVHFPSIRIEDVGDLCKELVSEFPSFKKEMLVRRGFKK